MIEPLHVLRFVQNGWCVEFKTSDVTVFDGEERLASNYLDYFLLDVRRQNPLTKVCAIFERPSKIELQWTRDQYGNTE